MAASRTPCLLVAAILAVSAGCLNPKAADLAKSPGPSLPPLPAFINPAILKHEHKDLSLHNVSNGVSMIS